MRGPCWHCGSDDADLDEMCPRMVRCPSCNAEAGVFCRRPSGHQADVLHATRIQAAEELRQHRVEPTYDAQEPLDGLSG